MPGPIAWRINALNCAGGAGVGQIKRAKVAAMRADRFFFAYYWFSHRPGGWRGQRTSM